MDGTEEFELQQYEKGDFVYVVPTMWEHVGGEGFVDNFEHPEMGRLSIEVSPWMIEGEDLHDPTLLFQMREPIPGEHCGPIVRLASGFAFLSYTHPDSEIPNFRWLNCELCGCLPDGGVGVIRYSACVSEDRLALPETRLHAHLLRSCARMAQLAVE